MLSGLSILSVATLQGSSKVPRGGNGSGVPNFEALKGPSAREM
jgi:hypothetical protein